MEVEYTIQTNGTLIDDELAALFKEHDYLVGISIDGPPAMHDAYRVDRGGAPTSDRVLRGLEALKRHGVEFNTLTTLHQANADHPLEVYRYLRDDLGSRYLQFIPIIERLPAPRIDVPLEELGLSPGLAQEAPWRSWRDRPLYRQAGELVTDRSVTAEQYGAFLVDGVRGVGPARHRNRVRADVRRRARQLVRGARWPVRVPADLRRRPRDGAQRRRVLVRPLRGGGLQARQHHRDADGRARGVSEPQRQFGQAKLETLPQYCLDCDVRFACHGACPKDRFIRTPDGEPGLNYLCAGYKTFFHHVDGPMRAMCALLRRGRAPSELMAAYAERDAAIRAAVAKTGRNDPCPCGSGRKTKHCHGAAA